MFVAIIKLDFCTRAVLSVLVRHKWRLFKNKSTFTQLINNTTKFT